MIAGRSGVAKSEWCAGPRHSGHSGREVLVLEVPRHLQDTGVERAKLLKERGAHVDVVRAAARALVTGLTPGALAICCVGDVDVLVAVTAIAVDVSRDGDNLVAVDVVEATSSKANVVPGATSGVCNTLLKGVGVAGDGSCKDGAHKCAKDGEEDREVRHDVNEWTLRERV